MRASAAASPGAAAFEAAAEALLLELGVPASRVAGTLRAAAALHAAPVADRALLHLTAEAPALPEVDPSADGTSGGGSSSAGSPPFASPVAGVREAWALALRSHAAHLAELGLEAADVGALLASFPMALLLPRDGTRPAAEFLGVLGLTSAELASVLRAAPRLLAFSPDEQLAPAVAYLQGCGLGRPALLGLLRAQPALALGAVEHKARTDRAAAALRAAYQLQSEERTAWAVDAAAAARRGLLKRGW